jgi:hypothetical protein
MGNTRTSLGLESRLDAIRGSRQVRSWHTGDSSGGLQQADISMMAPGGLSRSRNTYQQFSKRELFALTTFVEDVFLERSRGA